MEAEPSTPSFFNRAILEIPASALNGFRGFACDAGGTLLKLVHTEDDPVAGTVRLHLGSLANTEIETALTFMKQTFRPDQSNFVGGDKFILKTAGWMNKMSEKRYEELLGVIPECVHEFDSYGYGFYHLLDVIGPRQLLHNVITCPAKERAGTMQELRDHMVRERSRDFMPESRDLYPALVGFLGSGIGYTKVEADGTCSDFHLGPFIGGMFFWSMGRVLTQCKNYEELQSFVKAGNPGNLSDVLSDTPPGMCNQMYDFDLLKEAFSHLGETLVQPFGKLGRGEVTDVKKEHLAASLLHTICYEIVEQGVLFARGPVEELSSQLIRCCQEAVEARHEVGGLLIYLIPSTTDTHRWHGCKSLFFCGSFTCNNKTFSDYVQRAPLFDIKLTGPELIVGQLNYESYISSLGCLLLAARQQQQQQQQQHAV